MQDAQQQLLAAQSEAAHVAKAKAMMEVETLRIAQRIEILNNMMTQATLLAGSSITFLGGEALETVDDYETTLHHAARFIYVGSGALALVSSLWVIVVSSHLIALTRDASLRKNIIKASVLLDTAMKEVRGFHQLALAMLLLACLFGALLNMHFWMSMLVITIFAGASVQVFFKQQFLSAQFYEEVELEPEVAEIGSPVEIFHSFLLPLHHASRERVRDMCERERVRKEEFYAKLHSGHSRHSSPAMKTQGSSTRAHSPSPSS
jgi:hypothetical protein